jgi:hypothetical protein
LDIQIGKQTILFATLERAQGLTVRATQTFRKVVPANPEVWQEITAMQMPLCKVDNP